MITDNAGNVTIETFGPYEIVNSAPETSAVEVTVYEHELISGDGKNKVTINLNNYDIDVDMLTYNITDSYAVALAAYGTWTQISDTEYTFEHNGDGAPTVATPLTVRFEVTDGASETVADTITIKVIEVNDAPTEPLNPISPDEGTIYTAPGTSAGGSTINLTWTDGSDEKTATPALQYEVQITYDGKEWTTINTATGTSYSYPLLERTMS